MAEYPDPNLRYDLPAELVTPEKLEAAAQEQRRLAQIVNSPYAHKTAQDIQRFNASIIIQETEKMLEGMSDVAREQYAEALAEVGNYDKAAKVTKNKDKKKDWGSIWKAILKDDSETCKCVKGKHTLHAELEIWSHKHNRIMPIIRCNNCGHRNVRALPENLAKDRELRKHVRSHTTGKTHSDAKQIMQQILK